MSSWKFIGGIVGGAFAVSGTVYATGNPQITFFGFDEVIPNRNFPKPSREELEKRSRRLEHSPAKVLYHQTSKDSAKAILDSNKMLRGSSGLAGGGIYFATTPEHTNHKALAKGVILECEVVLGDIKTVPKSGDSSMCFRKLIHESKDSVLIPRDNGHEYVIYSHDQVVSIREYKKNRWKFWD